MIIDSKLQRADDKSTRYTFEAMRATPGIYKSIDAENQQTRFVVFAGGSVILVGDVSTVQLDQISRDWLSKRFIRTSGDEVIITVKG